MPRKKARLSISNINQELIKAAENDPPQWDVVAKCLKQGADPNVEIIVDGHSIKLILQACLDKEYNIVDELIVNGAELNHLINDSANDFYGCNVFWFAASDARWATCDLLLANKTIKMAEIDAPCKSKKYFNTTAIWWATYYDNVDLLKKTIKKWR